MTAVQLTTRERHWILLLLVVVVAVRLATLPAYPLLDPTESRYAEIARMMLETGNWLVPQVDYGVPFWGKPPLSMWLSAAAMAVLGVNEFAARREDSRPWSASQNPAIDSVVANASAGSVMTAPALMNTRPVVANAVSVHSAASLPARCNAMR